VNHEHGPGPEEDTMSKVDQRAIAPESGPGFEVRMHDLGGYTVSFEHYTEDADPAPLFVGLPNDHCQCPHWGTVLEGRLVYRYEDGSTDVIEAGEAYYARPGHLPLFVAGARIVEFSPTDQLAATIDVVMNNLAAT
jgi:hypothetical protein